MATFNHGDNDDIIYTQFEEEDDPDSARDRVAEDFGPDPVSLDDAA